MPQTKIQKLAAALWHKDPHLSHAAAHAEAQHLLSRAPAPRAPQVLSDSEIAELRVLLRAPARIAELMNRNRPLTFREMSEDEQHQTSDRVTAELRELLLHHPELPLSPIDPIAALLRCTGGQLSHALQVLAAEGLVTQPRRFGRWSRVGGGS